MISCITLKNDIFKQFKIKNVDEENIYKKCGYKSSTNVKKLYSWIIEDDKHIELWCKVDPLCKSSNHHAIFSKYSISVNINNKCLFLLKHKNDYINLDSKFFNEFFNLKEVIETGSNDNDNDDNSQDCSKAKNIKGQNDNMTINDKNLVSNKNEDTDVNSELCYELYSYSDEELDKL